MHTIRILKYFATIIALIPLTACSFPAQDELECVLPNGDKLILINQFDYDPLSQLCIRDCTSRMNEGRFKVFFEPKGQKLWGEQISGAENAPLKEVSSRQKTCAAFGVFGTTVSTNYLSIIDFESKHIIDFTGKILDSKVLDRLLASKEMYKFDGAYVASFSTGQLIFEKPYGNGKDMDQNNTVGAKILSVIQSTSTDGGKTWSEPIITTDSKLFEIGKPLIDQKGIAKPGKYSIGPGSN